ncbi:MAG: T9SS type A sorting domain-containing protein [Bacteroidia bacterium]|nr:T9SS type A sorting domain-containing protein [Bacteroidia bacterium]
MLISNFYRTIDNDTKINSEVGYFPNKIAYDANISLYSYDQLGATSAVGYGSAIAYGLVKYTASAAQQITKIGTWVNGSSATVDIYIYDDFDGSTLTNLLGSLTGQSCTLPGYYTFTLSSAISISNGNDFYIKIKYNTPTYNFPIPTEKAITGYASPVLESGKCWISSSGASWTTVGSGSGREYDVCIKSYNVGTSVTSSTFTGTGNWSTGTWSDGVPTASVNAIIDGACTVTATATCKNLTINETKSLTLNSGISLSVNSDFLIKSSATGTGLFNDQEGTLTVSGTKTIQRYITATNWHIVSSPVTNALSGVFNGIYLKYYDPSAQNFTYITSSTESLTPGKGYFAWATSNSTVSFSGTLNSTNSFNIAVTHAGDNWNLVGNPFPCNVDWALEGGWTKTNINASTMYVYDPSYNGGDYRSHNGTVGVPGGSSSIIPAGNGFWVEASSTGNLNVRKTALTTSSQSFYKSVATPANMFRMRADKEIYSNETVIYFEDGVTNNYDPDKDAKKFFTDNQDIPQIYTTAPTNEQLCINVLSALPNNVVVPLGIYTTPGNIAFTAFDYENMDANENVFLEDVTLSQMIDIRQQPVYSFTFNTGDENRFLLHFNYNQTNINPIDNSEISIYSFGKNIYVNNGFKENATIKIYNLLGNEILASVIRPGLNRLPMNPIAGDVYIVKAINGKKIFTKKIMISK